MNENSVNILCKEKGTGRIYRIDRIVSGTVVYHLVEGDREVDIEMCTSIELFEQRMVQIVE